LNAPRVAPLGMELGLKYQLPYTPEIVVWIVFLSHSDIQYMANVTKTSSPITLPLLQPPAPLLHCELFGFGVYWTYIETRVTEYHAPNAAARRPPIRDTT
jgi:hypothetical protein